MRARNRARAAGREWIGTESDEDFWYREGLGRSKIVGKNPIFSFHTLF